MNKYKIFYEDEYNQPMDCIVYANTSKEAINLLEDEYEEINKVVLIEHNTHD